MAQYRKDQQSYLPNGQTIYEVTMQADQYGNIVNPTGSLATERSAFGELLTVTPTPVLQLDGLYGLDPLLFENYNSAGGGSGTTGTLMTVNTGTSLNGYGVLRSRRAVRYRPGQGAMTRFTAMFTAANTDIVSISGEGTVSVEATKHLLTSGDYVVVEGTTNFNGTFGPITVTDADNFSFAAVGNATPEATGKVTGQAEKGVPIGPAGYTQRAGFFTQEQALQVGYNGRQFGVLRANGMKAHIERFTITTPATSPSTLTIDLPGYAGLQTFGPINVTNASGDPAITASEIGYYFNTPGQPRVGADGSSWTVEWCNDTITFVSTATFPLTGTAVLNAGSTGTVATRETLQSGVAAGPGQNNWTYQQDFNIDKLDGTGPSGIVLDPTKLNVFQIAFRWLGAGEIRYAIENPINGDMVFFHHEHYSNQNVDVHLDNPSLKIGYVAYSLTETGKDVIVRGASMMGAIEGQIQTTKLPISAYNDTGAGANLTSDTWHNILNIKNRLVSNDKINSREILIKNINVAITGNSPGTVLFIINPTGLSDPEIRYKPPYDYSSTDISADDFRPTLTLGQQRPGYSFTVPAGGSTTINLEDLRIALPPNNLLGVFVRSTAQITRSSVAVSWVED